MDPVIVDEVNMDDDQHAIFLPRLRERAYKIAVDVSATNFGQMLLKQVENIVYVTEKTAKWSCTPDAYGNTIYYHLI